MVLESVPKSITLKEIQLQTKNYPLLTLIMGELTNNSWHKEQKEVYAHYVNALMSLKCLKINFQ